MQFIELVYINIKIIAVICLLSYLLTKSNSFHRAIHMISKGKDIIVLSLYFGGLSIVGSFLGVEIFNNVMIQSSMIGPIVGGIIAGPIVGISSGVIGGLYNYYLDSVVSIPFFYSNIIAGLFGSFLYRRYGRERLSIIKTFLGTFSAELVSILFILKFTEPYILAKLVVKMLAPTTILINSLGAAFFVAIIKDIRYSHDLIGANYAEKALEIAKQTLPILKAGLNRTTANQITEIIYKYANANAVAITDTENILAFKGVGSDHHLPGNPVITSVTQQAIDIEGVMTSKVLIANTKEEIGCKVKGCPLDAVVAAPLTCNAEFVGYIKVYRVKMGINSSDIKMVTGIANLLSLQLQNAKLDEQAKLLARAEYSALRSQVNPHFLFNTLSVIKYLVTHNPQYAKDTIVRLASFYRKVLKRSDDLVLFEEEVQVVKLYIDLQKARFAEKLEVIMDIDEKCYEELFPSFVLEPIVENAIKHGFSNEMGKFMVKINARKKGNFLQIIVVDSGLGFDHEIIHAVENDIVKDNMGIGLTNINRRLKSLYGNNYTFKLENISEGAKVFIRIPTN